MYAFALFSLLVRVLLASLGGTGPVDKVSSVNSKVRIAKMQARGLGDLMTYIWSPTESVN